jgi:hypothetical protein
LRQTEHLYGEQLNNRKIMSAADLDERSLVSVSPHAGQLGTPARVRARTTTEIKYVANDSTRNTKQPIAASSR